MSTKDQSVEGRGKAPNTSNRARDDKIKKRYDPNSTEHEKLQFLNNPIRRPYGLVEDDPKCNEDEVPQSMATTARLANLFEKDQKIYTEAPHFNKNDDELLHSVDKEERSDNEEEVIVNNHIDFGSLDDIKDQGQLKQEFGADEDDEDKHNIDLLKDEIRDSLTFKPEGYLRSPKHEVANTLMTPMTFENNVLHTNTIDEVNDE